jgi:hypothetical protein
MKTKIILLWAMLAAICTSAQTDFREVNGQLYNSSFSKLWKIQTGKILEVQTNGVVLQTFTNHNVYQNVFVEGRGGTPGSYGSTSDHYEKRLMSSDLVPEKRIFINNYHIGAVDQEISVPAMKTGTIQIGGTMFEEWDCGTSYITPPPTPEQIKAAQEAAEARAIADKKKTEQGQVNAVRWLQSQATNGDASAQYSLGLHYLNGEGCETNREQATYWLQKSAAQGYIEASNKLANLQK